MIVTRTPFRISFFGGGTDYPEYFERYPGAVLATAIDKSLFLSATHFYSGLFDYSLRIAYSRVECAQSLEQIEHIPFREILRSCGITRDLEISYAAELPSLSGIGSSSSFVVGLLNTLAAYQERVMPPLELAYRAIDIERDVLHEAVGCQDQVLAAVGGFCLVEFRRKDDICVHQVPLTAEQVENLEQHLFMVFTGIRRRASAQAARQVERLDMNVSRLQQLRAMVDDAYEALVGTTSLEGFGRLLHASWQVKRALETSISNKVIERIYTTAMESGAWGGKLLGAGGGGFLLFVIPPERRARIKEQLADFQEIPIRLNAAGSEIIFNSAAK